MQVFLKITDKSLEALVENGIPNQGSSGAAADVASGAASPAEAAKAASMLVVLAKNASNVRSTVNFLERRGFAARVVTNLNEAVELFTKKEANMLLLSVNFPHPKVEMLPVLMNQSFQIETILYAEDTDRKTSSKLNNAKTKHVLFGPVSGPVVMMKIRQIDREMNGGGDADEATGSGRVSAAKEEGGDIKIGGRKGSSDDTVVLNGRADTDKKASFDNLMKSLDGAAADSAPGESLERSGETYVAKGERAKMNTAGGDPSPDDNETLSERAQDLRAAIDRGLEAASPTSRSRLIMPNSFASKPREGVDAGVADGPGDAGAADGAGAAAAGVGAAAADAAQAAEASEANGVDGADSAGGAKSAYDAAVEAMRAAEHANAVEAARAREEKEAAEAARRAEKEAASARAKAEREALAAKQRAEREANSAQMKADREAAVEKAKADREAAAEQRRNEREAAEVEAKAAAAKAAVAKSAEEKQIADAKAQDERAKRAERARKERDDGTLGAAEVGAVATMNAAATTGAAAATSATTGAPETGAANAADAGQLAEAMREASAGNTRASERGGQANAAKPSSAEQPAGAVAERELTEAEKFALSPEDKIQRCLREALAIVAGAPRDEAGPMQQYAKAALISLRTAQVNCAFVVSMNYAKQTAAELFHRMEIAFFSLLRDYGVEFENNQTYSILLDNMNKVEEAFQGSVYSVVTHTTDIEMGAARVFVTNPVAKIEPYEENMHSISLRELPLDVPVTFSLFLHLKRNEKFIRYLKKGSSISDSQVGRLESRHAQGLVEQNEVEAYRRHYAAHAIKKSAS